MAKRLSHNKLKCNDQQINKIHSNPNDQQITNPNDTYNKQRTLMTKITKNQTNLNVQYIKQLNNNALNKPKPYILQMQIHIYQNTIHP